MTRSWLFSYYFVSDRIMCVLVNFYMRGHFVMFIIKSLHLISVLFWTYLSFLRPKLFRCPIPRLDKSLPARRQWSWRAVQKVAEIYDTS